MKSENVKIINIISKDGHIYGLGDDSMVYFWLADTHQWMIGEESE